MNRPAGRHDEDGEPDLNALAAWVDGRLDSAGRADVSAHLAGCPACRAIVAELARSAAPAVRSWRPVLAIAATIAVAAVGGGAYFIVQQRERPTAVPPAHMGPVAPAPSAATPSTTPPTAVPSRPSIPSPPSDRKRAAGTTTVNGKTFHLVAGEWVDNSYRESDFLPVVEVRTREQLDAAPALRPYATLGSRFTVVIRGTVYQVALP